MAQLLRRRKDHALIAAVDIGASKVSCFIARVSSEDGLAPHAEIIGVGHHGAPVKLKTAASADQFEYGLRRAVDAAERMADVTINRVCVGVAGRYLRTRRIGVDLAIADNVVTREDLEDSLTEGARLAVLPEYAPLHAIPTGYKLDGEEVFDDPVGLSGATLSTEMLGISARQSVLDNLSSVIERCGLSVDEFYASPYAAAEATLIEDEKDLGVVLIDIGAASTDYAVYDNGALIDCGGVKVGGGHITKDIAQIFGTPLAQAERIKTLHGAALIGPGDEHRFVDFPPLSDGDDNTSASRADLCDVIIPRVEEIFEMIADELPDDSRSRLRRVVITGGGSLLVGAREIAERVLSMKCRIGRPISLAGAPEAASAPGFAACAGLIQCSLNSRTEDKFTLGAPGQSLHTFSKSAFLGGVEAWLRAKF